jgi:oligoribonuclease
MDMKLRNLRPTHVLWVDLEMTGVNPDKDLILEVAAIITDWDFKEFATYEGIIKHKETNINKRMKKNSDFWKANPDSKNALLKQNHIGKSLKTIENELIKFIDEHFKAGIPILLAGNSIHMDRRFIIANWPKFDQRLHYRMLDVSAWKVVFEGKYKTKFAKPDNHRALEDIRGSMAELQYYLSRLK